ncbi:tyrosine-type recombinase/integrase [Rariglobus hedericola]|uniref:tyrosine-type recombinase/integrase n=1 Tax=Rariglobus hedericola TaxID=2597822 RepID=UPI0039EA5855
MWRSRSGCPKNWRKKFSLHSVNWSRVRRSLFTRENGVDIRTVQDLLGHESVETTQKYLHVMQKPGLGVRSPLDV